MGIADDTDKKLRELIWYELGDGLNATDVDEAVISIKSLIYDLCIATLGNKYPVIGVTRTQIDYARGYNKCRSEAEAQLSNLIQKEKMEAQRKDNL